MHMRALPKGRALTTRSLRGAQTNRSIANAKNASNRNLEAFFYF